MSLHSQAVGLLAEQPWVISLAIPLTSSEQPALETPTPTSWRGQVSDFSPPGLYVVTAKLLLSPWSLAEFRAPLAADFGLRPAPGSVLRYTCARSQEDADRGWDWQRTIWIDHWPEIDDRIVRS